MTKYQEIKEWIKESINEGFFSYHDKLPSEKEIVDLFKVSRHTVRKAVSDLVNEGLLFTKKGSGIYFTGSKDSQKKQVALILPAYNSYDDTEIIKGIYEELNKNNTNIIINYSNYSFEKELEILNTIQSDKINGIIITPVISSENKSNVEELLKIQKSNIPIVLLDAETSNTNLNSVSIDNKSGGNLAAKFLYEKGHRSISIIYSYNSFNSIKRYEGAKLYINSHGIKIGQNRKELSINIASLKTYRDKIRELIINIKKPAGIICTSDEIGFFTVNSILSENFRIPEDISIIGFGNSFFNNYAKTPLSSINYQKETLGRVAGQFIINAMDFDQSLFSQSNKIKPNIVDRGSVRNLNM